MNKQMKVYTHYNKIANTDMGYRWRTLLQFGNSWDVIGSIVMMNPGGANFKYPDHHAETDKELLNHLRQFDNDQSFTEDWYEFGSDPTLNLVNELFTERARLNGYGNLNGVIQIFNLFYLKDPNPNKGIALNNQFKLNDINDKIFNDDIKNLKAPCYLGFGQLSQHSQFRDKAKCFFDKTIHELGVKYLSPVFEENSFMHPRRLMRFMKNKPEGMLMKLQFCYDTRSSDKFQGEIGYLSKLSLIKSRLRQMTSAKWWIYQGWDLGISFNDKTNKIGLESWYGRKNIENDDYFHVFVTVWDTNCFVPYKEELIKRYPNAIIDNMGFKNRIYLHLPTIKSTHSDIIVEALNNYYYQLLEIIKTIK